jgi:hypothetical protein
MPTWKDCARVEPTPRGLGDRNSIEPIGSRNSKGIVLLGFGPHGKREPRGLMGLRFFHPKRFTTRRTRSTRVQRPGVDENPAGKNRPRAQHRGDEPRRKLWPRENLSCNGWVHGVSLQSLTHHWKTAEYAENVARPFRRIVGSAGRCVPAAVWASARLRRGLRIRGAGDTSTGLRRGRPDCRGGPSAWTHGTGRGVRWG